MSLASLDQIQMKVRQLNSTIGGKKIIPNKKGDIGMEVRYLCQPNSYVIDREFGEQQ